PDAEGIADGENVVADLYFGGIADGDVGEIVAVDLEHGDIGLGIGSHHAGFELALVAERDGYGAGSVHDVVIGQHVSFGADDHARAQALLALLAGLALLRIAESAALASLARLIELIALVAELVAEELAEQRIHGHLAVAGRSLDHFRGGDIDDRG